MILAEYKLDILGNIIARLPIILGLIIVLIVVLLVGIYIQCTKTKDLMKDNNELLKEIKYMKSYQSQSTDKDK